MTRTFVQDIFNVPAIVAGFVKVLVGYASAAAIIFQAAAAAGASEAEISSWMWALGLGMGLSCIGLSLFYKTPVACAWSTPGAALLVTSLPGFNLSEAVGAFIVCSVLIALVGFTGIFERLMNRVPSALASAMLAGILLRFGLDVFVGFENNAFLVGTMLLCYLMARQLVSRYAIPLVLLSGVVIAFTQGTLSLSEVHFTLTEPVWTAPTFTLDAIISIAVPLFIVTMASQNMPGVAMLRANGYTVNVSPLVGWTGITGIVFACFGGFCFCLAAITAAICMGRDVHEEADKRYWATVWGGVFYLIAGVFGATVVALFAAFPKPLILAIAGLALLATIGNSLFGAITDEKHREPALIVFLVTASGMSLLSIGSAFWGIVLGALYMSISYGVQQLKRPF
ncbi:benzoate/H(+) symporter BenE family transporter [Marinibactrum halimedae]|uniref:Benzoate transporter n=1 Tax=Marinibactrum halimedae TaxID=1444977 RepID=A0AA37WLB1_9GAMM|nr:benzoate/H(+) symporter BenE family transporter [Marinibactrum halimedae]MCD9458167.1 benzoate/H(+) symporter BenE family transporter [Marinibactrum halimedae]GLS25100.1 benzoate transporter [Marinibactrum halimedae]